MSNYRNKELVRFAEIFNALSNTNRVKILRQLLSCCAGEPMTCPEGETSRCVGDLGRKLNIAPSTVSHHIKELQRAGLIRITRRGRNVLCQVHQPTMKKLAAFFTDCRSAAALRL